jgi:hypothetical protein
MFGHNLSEYLKNHIYIMRNQQCKPVFKVCDGRGGGKANLKYFI